MSEALFLPINTELKNDIKKQEEAELERDNMTGRVINDLENMKGLAGESGFESLSLEEQQAIIRKRLQEPENMKWVGQYSNANMVKTDFFEAKSTAYAKSTALIDDL